MLPERRGCLDGSSSRQTALDIRRGVVIDAALVAVLLIGYGLAFWQVHNYEAGVTRHAFIIHGSVATPALLLSPRVRQGNAIAIVVHGTAADKELMLSVGIDLAREGIPTYLFDLPGHGQSSATLQLQDDSQVTSAINDVFTYASQHSDVPNLQFILIGYSGGTTLVYDYLVDLAEGFYGLTPTIAATILISPELDMGGETILPGNVLFLAGGLDLPGLRDQARAEIANLCGQPIAASATRFDCTDPAIGAAYELFVSPGANHISMVTDAAVIGAIDRWSAMTAQIPPPPNTSNTRIIWLAIGFLCAFLALFPLFRLGLFLLPEQCNSASEAARQAFPLWGRILIFAGSLVAGNAFLYGWSWVAEQSGHLQWLTPLSPVGIAWADYLASSALVSGLIALGVFTIFRRRMPARDARRLGVQLALGAVAFLFAYVAIGTLVSSGWENLLLDPRRLLAAVPLTIACAPLFFAIETLLADRTIWQIWIGRVSAYLLFLASSALPVLFDSRLALVLIILPVEIVFFLLLVIQSSVMRHAGKPVGFAVALFAACAFGWLIAAVFPFVQY
jgi:pimeloyl-ACP methyl ester carboxylesterase